MTNGRTGAPLVTLLMTTLLLAGCGTPPWDEGASATASPVPSASPSPSASKPAEVQNDLAKGSAERTLTAGGVELAVTYFSTLDLGRWTPAATKPLSLALSASFADGSEQDIFLKQVRATVDVAAPDGPLPAAEPLVDQASVAPGYLVTSPISYSQVFTVPTLPPEATTLTLNLTYELLAPSAPKSKTYLKQSASDTLVIALAGT
ncbi:hypothetical protein GCM10009616_30760 [Microlunatus lacustris]